MQTGQLFPTSSPNGFGQTSIFTVTTDPLDPGESTELTVSTSGSFLLLRSTTDVPAWVRFYGSAYGRDQDLRVNPGTPFPEPGTGFFAEVQTTGHFLETFFSPAPEVQSELGSVYLRVRNDSATTTEVTIAFEVSVGAYPESPQSPPYGCATLVNTMGQLDLSEAWKDCTTITQLPLLNLDSATNLESAWEGCSNLSFVPQGFLNGCPCTNLVNAFVGCSLSEQSVDNILVSLDSAGESNGTVDITGGFNSAPSSTGLAAKTSLEGRGWTVNVESASVTSFVDIGEFAFFMTSRSDGTVFAGTALGNVFKSVDFGVSFDAGTSVVPGSEIYCLAACDNGNVLAGTYDYTYLFLSTDDGGTWAPGEDFDELEVNSLAFAGGDTVYAGTFGYIHKSTDNGLTWPQSNSPYSSDYYVSLAFPGPDKVVVGSFDYGFISYSSDGGVTWGYTADYILNGAERIYGLASNGDGIVVAGTLDNGQVFTSSDSGVTWNSGFQLGSATEINTVAYSQNGTFYAGTDDDGKIYSSGDNGATWTEFFDPSIPAGYVYSLTATGNRLIAGIDTFVYSIPIPALTILPTTQVFPTNSAGGGDPLPTNLVVSDTTGITGASQIANMVSLSQTDYNNIVSPDPQTLYIITP